MEENEFLRLVEMYRETVYRLAYCYTKSDADAEDVSQDVFLRLYMRENVFADDESAKAWLLRVTMNRAKDLLRTHWYRFSLPLDSAADVQSEPSGENEVLAAIMKLRPAVRSAVYLHYVEGYTSREIAGMLGCTETAVTSRLMRGREQLRRLLAEEDAGKGGVSL